MARQIAGQKAMTEMEELPDRQKLIEEQKNDQMHGDWQR